MSIEIKITDPHLAPVHVIRSTVIFLEGLIARDVLGRMEQILSAPVENRPSPSAHTLKFDPSTTTATLAESQFTPAEHAEQPKDFGPVETPSLDLTAFGQAGASVTPPPPPPTQVPMAPSREADVNGVLWDGRIHSSSKALNKDGSWRIKRGVHEEILHSVMTQQRMAMNAPAPAPEPVAAQIPAPPQGTAVTFAEFMKMATKQNQVDHTFMQRTTQKCVEAGLANLAGLHARPDLIPTIMRQMGCPV